MMNWRFWSLLLLCFNIIKAEAKFNCMIDRFDAGNSVIFKNGCPQLDRKSFDFCTSSDGVNCMKSSKFEKNCIMSDTISTSIGNEVVINYVTSSNDADVSECSFYSLGTTNEAKIINFDNHASSKNISIKLSHNDNVKIILECDRLSPGKRLLVQNVLITAPDQNHCPTFDQNQGFHPISNEEVIPEGDLDLQRIRITIYIAITVAAVNFIWMTLITCFFVQFQPNK